MKTKLYKLRMKRSKISRSLIRDKYGNVKKNGWNRWMIEEIDKLDKEIEKRQWEYILPNCEEL